jgi:hypothetical protein
LLGVLHLVDRLLLDVVPEPVIAPVVAHLRVEKVLVDGGQLFAQRDVQLLDHLRVTLHAASFDARWRDAVLPC